MERKNQICEAGQQYLDSMDEFQRCHTYPKWAFIAGAKWADANPQFSKEKFIEKAYEWLSGNKNNYIIDIEGETIVDDAIIEDFLKAMEE